MKALITGASCGIGREIARELARRGCDLILCSRNEAALKAVADEVAGTVSCEIVPMDLSTREGVKNLYQQTKNRGVNILVNNAGFGVFGPFVETDLEAELDLIDLNISALHALTKYFLLDFKNQRERCHILNVSSMAGFFAGPLFATYYASKNYVTRLTEALAVELKHSKSNISVSLLCPGPVHTNFGLRAGVGYGGAGTPIDVVAREAVDGMFAGKLHIVPGRLYKFLKFANAFLPTMIAAEIVGKLQGSKNLAHRYQKK
ncbi:MAG: SDR family oxidoreductase [Opitutales bacterium]|nr:SDR family oxidoreductase [Opitutales bacterium]